jgi:hypothetical protein
MSQQKHVFYKQLGKLASELGIPRIALFDKAKINRGSKRGTMYNVTNGASPLKKEEYDKLVRTFPELKKVTAPAFMSEAGQKVSETRTRNANKSLRKLTKEYKKLTPKPGLHRAAPRHAQRLSSLVVALVHIRSDKELSDKVLPIIYGAIDTGTTLEQLAEMLS